MIFAVSVAVGNYARDDGVPCMNYLVLLAAVGTAEAIGLAIQETQERYPPDKGWLIGYIAAIYIDPQVVADEAAGKADF